ncbi:MAG: hypothetical protein AAB576_06255, partial [Elusimicrobiota bacterium]
TAAGGARFDGGAADFTNSIAVDNVTAGGPFVYVSGFSDQGNGIVTMLAKYDAVGNKLARAFPNMPGGTSDDFFTDSQGRVYVTGGDPNYIRRLDSSLAAAASRAAGQDAFFESLTRGPGDTFYASMRTWQGGQGFKIWRMDSSLAALSTATYSLPPAVGDVEHRLRGLVRDGSGNLYTMVSQGALHLLFKYAADDLSTAPLIKDISQHIPSELDEMGVDLAADFSGNLYISYLDRFASPLAGRILKFDSSLAYQASAANTDVSAGLGFPSLDVDGAGAVYAGWVSAAGDFGVQRYDSSLVLLSSRTFDGGLGKFDGVAALSVVDSSSVFVTGSVSGQKSLDWATLNLNMNASGSFSAPGSTGIVIIADYVSGTARYGGASTGTLKA